MNEYIDKIKALNKEERFHISTFGCQMNVHDSEKLHGMLLEMGYMESKTEEAADIIVYNTCCIRENAENKVYGNLGNLKHIKEVRKQKGEPDMKIILCGCMVQQDAVLETLKKTYRHVDVIFGTYNLDKFPELLYKNIVTNKTVVDIWDSHMEINEDLPTKREQPHKASVNIMFGCDNYCTYCIVPYVRGRERSRKMQDVLAEIEALALDGVTEIMLLGQNVNSYHDGAITFPTLLEHAARIKGIRRIRFMTSHPKDLSDELIRVVRDNANICNCIHLPMQSGSTEVLSAMNRRYTKKSYLELVERIRMKIPDVAITTDIIVGFPGETEEDFKDTLEVVEKSGFSGAYTFIYSRRTGTPADKMENQIEEKVSKERFGRLLKTQNTIQLALHKNKIGKTFEILIDSVGDANDELSTGRTDDNYIVHFSADNAYKNNLQIGDYVTVTITDCKTFFLLGELSN